MSEYQPAPDEIRDAWINDADAGSFEGTETVEAKTQEGQIHPLFEKLLQPFKHLPDLPHIKPIPPIMSKEELAERLAVHVDHDSTTPDLSYIESCCEWFDEQTTRQEERGLEEEPYSTEEAQARHREWAE
jgi:hypothetical protein